MVIPLTPKLGWDEVKAFAKWVADNFVAQRPEDFTANMAKKGTAGPHLYRLPPQRPRRHSGRRLFASGPERRPVSTPLYWEEVEQGVLPEHFTVETVPNRLTTVESDPWADMGILRQSISAMVQRRIGI